MKKQIFILIVTSWLAAPTFAQSRKIVSEDTRTMPAEQQAATGTTTGYAAAVNGPSYLDYSVAGTTAAPLAYPTPPSPDASLPVMQAAIQAFMQYMQSPAGQKNMSKYPDYVNPATVNRQSTAPSVDPRPLKDCGGLAPAAKEKMKAYLSRCGSSLRIPNGNVSIIDFSTSRPVLYVLRQSDLSCVTAVHVGYGVNSHGNPPRPNNTPSSLATPPGFHITKVHNGRAYQEFNSIGIQGMGSENSNTVGRGVILHPSNGHTHGCIGIPWAQFAEIKRHLGYGTVVYNYFPSQTNNDSENRCPTYRQSSYRTTSVISSSPAMDAADETLGLQ
ncbi:MAG: hypothetical protein KF767_09790 [Bdellovibrionaceae bacterium]|nr:hypothetical protein [Pseudobdellovibrionaceae bacterium]